MMEKSFYQSIVDTLCDHYNMAHIEVLFDASLLTNPNAGGQYNYIIGKIVIDPVLDEEGEDIMEVVFHEFRHYWQHYYYGDLFTWWTRCSGGLFKKYYWTEFNSIEEDARVFGRTYGHFNREDLLMMYDPETLSSFRDDEDMLRLTLSYLGLDDMKCD